MKKASQILLTVSIFYSAALALLFLGLAIAMFALGSPACTAMIQEGIQSGSINTSYTGDIETVTAAVQVTFIAAGAVMVPFFLFSVVNSILSGIYRGKEILTVPAAVVLIIFGILSGTYLSAIGGVLGMVADRNKR